MASVARQTVKVVSRGNVDGYGPTVREARADLEAKVDKALSQSYEPILLSYGGYTLLGYGNPSSWTYKVLRRSDLDKAGPVDVGGCSVERDRVSCLRSMAYHVVQLGMNIETTRADGDLPDFLTDPGHRRDLLQWARWQRAARWAMQNPAESGVADHNGAHAYACEHERDERFA